MSAYFPDGEEDRIEAEIEWRERFSLIDDDSEWWVAAASDRYPDIAFGPDDFE